MEYSKRSAIETRLHAQLLLQSESMVAMELKLLRLEAKVNQKEQRKFQRLGVITNTIEEDLPLEDILGQERQPKVSERAVVSSGASFVSAVTATSGLEDGISLKEEDEETIEGDNSMLGGIDMVAPEIVCGTEPSTSTTRATTLDSILLNPSFPSTQSMTESTRALRPPHDPTDASSIGTSATSATLTSTVITATTSSVANVRQQEERLPRQNIEEILALSPTQPRSRSQSPLTVPSTGGHSVGHSVGTSVNTSKSALTTHAIAPSRDFRTRRAAAAAAAAVAAMVGDSKPLTNRVVSFLSSDEILQASSEAGDSVTIPDEFDNLSDMVETFAGGATRWREEYESRLDTVQKQLANE